ncbi:substrate-binding domain-containing protein [Pontibaca methylaminivorans]|uniref:Phosphate ABC transporter substrate-binding protein, PhoT family n=1 Tax=Pontibaca methylaminivorans TaxID=515897 RepID=A0A1R3WD87_9RHOB|nr:substrate-binding domain-containing protein [Pontibaca methylaminivorans]SIT76129.1 phosphate ABC transporter substrate-binding protein, PhoT family [Pontibaca methylaminivorans]
MSRMKQTLSFFALATALTGGAAAARDQVQVAGSSTVLPYAAIVAEIFGENTDFPTPVIESGGSSAGLKKFCEGVGDNTIDIANASRRIKDSEVEACASAGVTDIIEVRFGYDGIVFASDINGEAFAFTPEDWYRALAAQVVVDGELVANPATTWDQVNPDLPAQPIMAFIPGTKHGTREVFDLNVIERGCKDSGAEEELAALVGDDTGKTCTALRTDGRAVEIDGDYTETLSRIASDKDGIGVFGLSFYENNASKLQVATMNGVSPSTETIASGEYPVSRPLFFYVKKAHIDAIPGLKDYAEFFVADDIAGPGGPLAEYGLVPDPELARAQAAVADEVTLD